MADTVFGYRLDSSGIELRGDKFSRFQPDGSVLAEAGRIWFGPVLADDFAHAPVRLGALFLHELTHCAQAQAGMDIWVRGAAAQVRAFVVRRSPYAYALGDEPLAGRPFEHQAAMIEDAYRMLHGVPPRRVGASLGDLLVALGHASDFRASFNASLSLGAPPLLNTPLR